MIDISNGESWRWRDCSNKIGLQEDIMKEPIVKEIIETLKREQNVGKANRNIRKD